MSTKRDNPTVMKRRLHHLHQQAIRTKWRIENIQKTRSRLDAEEHMLCQDAIRIVKAIEACEAGIIRSPSVPLATGKDHGGGPEHAPEVVATQMDSSANRGYAPGRGLCPYPSDICGSTTPNDLDGDTACGRSHCPIAPPASVRSSLSPEPESSSVAGEREQGEQLEPKSTGDV